MTVRNILLICGIASSVLYVGAIDVFAAIIHPEYHSYRYRMVSELFALEAPTRATLTVPMLLYNILVLAFAVGVGMAAKRRRIIRWLAVALGAYGIISMAGFFLVPMDVRGPEGVTDRDVQHMVGTALQGIALLAALVLGGFAFGPRFRVFSFATLGVSMVFGILASMVAAQEVSPWLGTTERVSIYAWMLWVGILGATLLREQVGSGDA
jgi:hypothetical protein